ncbi:MAG: PAS domain S-box protein [Phycisphaerales bacterium]
MEGAATRILLIEDNPADARLIRAFLDEIATDCAELTHVTSIEDAETIVREHGWPHVILLDLGLPGSRGLETFRQASRLHAQAPIVVLSGLDDEEVALEAVHSGAQDYLVKGRVSAEMVWRTIRYAIERHRSEEDIRAREDQIRQVADALPALVAYLDADERYQYNNRLYEEWFGRSRESLHGLHVSALLPPEVYAIVQPRLRQALAGEPQQFDIPFRDRAGVDRQLNVSYVPRHDREGKVIGVFALVYDITERKQAEEESELLQRLAFVIGSARDLGAAMRETLETICQATGWEYGEVWSPDIATNTILESQAVFGTDDAANQFSLMQNDHTFAFGEGLPGRVWKNRSPEWIERIDDESRFARATVAKKLGFQSALGVPILVGEEVVAVMLVLMREMRPENRRLLDLTMAAVAPLGPLIQRRRAEAALFESERRIREMLEGVDLIAIMLDRDGEITFANDCLLSLTGWVRDEIIGADWFDVFVTDDEREDVRRVFEHAYDRAHIAAHYENHIVTKSGKRLLVSWNNTIIRNIDGEPVGVTGLGLDITEQRRIQRELARYQDHLESVIDERTSELERTHEKLLIAERLASIGTLAAGLGHDMNNVLLPVRCRLEALRATELNREQRAEIDQIEHSTNYLQQLSDGLRLFALDPDDPDASTETTNLSSWWAQIAPLMNRSVPEKVIIQTDLPANLSPVIIPAHLLTQTVLNLVVNAGEAIGEESGIIRIQARSVDRPERSVVQINVSDTGCGMTDEVRRRALDPFFTTKRRGLSTGLGLSLVHAAVTGANGTLEIESTVGQGSTVTIELPAAPRLPHGSTERIAAAVTLSDARISAYVSTLLRNTGFDVHSISTAAGEPDAKLWIITADSLSSDSTRRFLDQDAARRVVVFGAGSFESPVTDRVTIVKNTTDLAGLRAALRAAQREIKGVHHDDAHAGTHSLRR